MSRALLSKKVGQVWAFVLPDQQSTLGMRIDMFATHRDALTARMFHGAGEVKAIDVLSAELENR